MNAEALIFNPLQLEMTEVTKEALKNALKKAGISLAADFPPVVSIKPRPLFIRQFIGGGAAAAGDKVYTFFDKAASAKEPFESNFVEASLPGGKYIVFFGVQLKTAQGAAAGTDDMGTLDFGTIQDPEVINGLIKMVLNGDENIIPKDTPIAPLFLTGDVIPGFFRLPSLAVWRPDNAIEFEVRLAKAFAAANYTYMEATIWGIEISGVK